MNMNGDVDADTGVGSCDYDHPDVKHALLFTQGSDTALEWARRQNFMQSVWLLENAHAIRSQVGCARKRLRAQMWQHPPHPHPRETL